MDEMRIPEGIKLVRFVKAHKCFVPSLSLDRDLDLQIGVGSIVECKCGKQWRLAHRQPYGRITWTEVEASDRI